MPQPFDATRRRTTIIDTDGGPDDLLAVLVALRSPELDVDLITTVSGNARSDVAAERIGAVAELAGGSAPPIVAGCDRPLSRQALRGVTPDSGDLQAVAVILDRVAAHSGAVTILTLGPLTNIATAIQRDRRAMTRVSELIVVGGTVLAPGNVTPYAEFNVFVDPEAAGIVLSSGIPIVLLPLDVTGQVIVPKERLKPSGSGLAGLVGDTLHQCVGAGKVDGWYVHDPLAVAVAIDPSFTDRTPARVDVELQSASSRGMTMLDTSRSAQSRLNVQLALHVDAPRFVKFFGDRILASSG
jgi:purine nucleosidase